jgi:CRISPR-associated protein Cas1
MIKATEDPDEALVGEGRAVDEAGDGGTPVRKAGRGRRDSAGQQLFQFDFTRRNRRPPRDAVNALLSLGYSLLARDCTVAAHAVGFDPYVGFYHQPRFGRPALALDLMEEFRPLVADSVAITAINTRIIGPGDFVRAGDAVNLSANGRKRFFSAYEQRLNATIVHPVFDYQVSYRRALELQARMLAKVLTGEIEQYVPFTTR